jgi:hypothetical protein
VRGISRGEDPGRAVSSACVAASPPNTATPTEPPFTTSALLMLAVTGLAKLV